ncbi:bifunctional 4-hydroxy-2-oxoglutarate aldolase/2-dehydro-3-deoxy-phosphogluconate aldolase [Paracoccaceae bacterium]|nr:bifunctional 4-hydroxy-2-oxoglutarate aldolase/2-dehydro-3-deoxy-phosphogluconate aldolase [Paracoccaceae bacterium]
MDITAKLIAARVAPVIRTSTEAAARRGVELLADEGFALFEITLTTPSAMEIIADLAKDPDLTVGVGTVLNVDQGKAAIDAGASFVVSPAFIPGLSEAGAVAGVPVALGAATPTEALRANEAGAAFVKVFPAAQLGGPGFIKALKSVYPMIDIMPTGGIEAGNLADYFAAGAACVGMGGKLVSDAALVAKDDEAIRAAARTVKAALKELA